MTNQEAINFLDQVRKILLDDKSWLESTIQPINEAFNMAISALKAQEQIPVSKRLPEKDHWLGDSGKQFSDNVLISITNREDARSYISQTIDGEWAWNLPSALQDNSRETSAGTV